MKETTAGNRVSGVCVKANMAPVAGNIYGRCRNCVMDDTTVIHWTCTGRGYRWGCGLYDSAIGRNTTAVDDATVRDV